MSIEKPFEKSEKCEFPLINGSSETMNIRGKKHFFNEEEKNKKGNQYDIFGKLLKSNHCTNKSCNIPIQNSNISKQYDNYSKSRYIQKYNNFTDSRNDEKQNTSNEYQNCFNERYKNNSEDNNQGSPEKYLKYFMSKKNNLDQYARISLRREPKDYKYTLSNNNFYSNKYIGTPLIDPSKSTSLKTKRLNEITNPELFYKIKSGDYFRYRLQQKEFLDYNFNMIQNKNTRKDIDINPYNPNIATNLGKSNLLHNTILDPLPNYSYNRYLENQLHKYDDMIQNYNINP